MLQTTPVEYRVDGHTLLSLDPTSIQKGEHVLVLGPSGSGKSTYLYLLAGLLRPTSGDVLFSGTAYSSLSDERLDRLRAEHFGFIFQKLHLIRHLTVAQNIALALNHIDMPRIEKILDDLGLADKKGQPAKTLSVGEAQRVALARAIVNNPKVIFADEPTSALDDVNAEKAIRLLLTQAEKTGATLIVATHDARIKGHFHKIQEMTV